MSHECPTCYMLCHCGGDIDDICMSDTDEETCCTHCDEFEGEEDEEPGFTCPNCGYLYDESDHEPDCKSQNAFFYKPK